MAWHGLDLNLPRHVDLALVPTRRGLLARPIALCHQKVPFVAVSLPLHLDDTAVDVRALSTVVQVVLRQTL